LGMLAWGCEWPRVAVGDGGGERVWPTSGGAPVAAVSEDRTPVRGDTA
jgi:hypothetical protein